MVTLDRTRQLRVGLLVVACSLMFVTLLAFIAGSALQNDSHSYFILYEENVKGMVVGSRVNFQGVPIGSVHDIRFQEGQTLVEVRVDPGRAVIQDVTRARLDRLLVTGQVTIELEGYDPTARRLPDRSFIAAASSDPIQELKTSLPSLLDKLDTLLTQTNTSLARVDRVLSDDNLARFERVLEGVARTAEVLPVEVESTAREARATLATFRPLADDVRATLSRAAGAADRLVAIADRTGTRAENAIGGVAALVTRLDQVVGGIAAVAREAEGMLGNNRHAVRNVLVGAAEAVRELQALARQLRAAPNSVLFGTDQGEIEVPAAPPRGGR